ncbi:MAG: FecR family protein [Planctomycetaceae bacterium]
MNEQIRSLIRAYANGVITPDQLEELERTLRAESTVREQFLQELNIHAALDDEALGEGGGDGAESLDSLNEPDALLAERSTTIRERLPRTTLLRLLLAVSAMVIVTLSASLLYQRSSADRSISEADRRIAEIEKINQRPATELPIARITGLSGTLIWTGDRGQIVRDVQVGTRLPGGTIEGMAPDSWFELEFNDGSTVMISGTSMLTFADADQKELRLRGGLLSANVVPQPRGKPMLIHTRSALLMVLGTQFDVEAGLTSTVLNVSKGSVRVKRLSDGSEVDVPAKHRVIAGADRELTPERIPDSVHYWKTQLDRGSEDIFGKWRPAVNDQPASVRAVLFVPRHNRSLTHRLLGLSVVRSASSPVIINPDSRFVVRGRLTTAANVFFGFRVSHANGEFAGKFLARQTAAQFENDSPFEAVFQLSDFMLDPCVRDRKDELPDRPDRLILTGVWCFTNTGAATGLEVTQVELIPPESQAADTR